MKKQKFIKSTIILIVGGFFTKLLGLFIRITVTRLVGEEGIGLYMLILPTFILFITLTQMGMPIAISKLVSEEKSNNKKLISSVITFSLFINIVLIILLFLIAPLLSNYLLRDSRTLLPLMAVAFVLPFISISSIIRGYFFGKERMFPHVISNLFEQIIRLILIILFIPNLIEHSLTYAIMGIIGVNIVSEVTSIITMILFLPKRKLHISEFLHPSISNIKSVLRISIPTTGSKIIGSIGYFFEPILLTFALLYSGYNQNFIVLEYGIINGYVISLLMIPSFFTTAISSALLPVITKEYAKGNKLFVKRRIKQALLISFSIGIFVTIFFILMPEFFLKLVYNTNSGANYLRILSPIFLLYYIQTPLTYILQALSKSKEAMYGTIRGIIVKTIILFGFSFLHIGLYGLIIAISLNITIVTLHHFKEVKKTLQ